MPKENAQTTPEGEEISMTAPRIKLLGRLIGSLIVIISLAEALDIIRALGIVLITEQLLALVLGLAIAVVFIMCPARLEQAKHSVPWYDAVAALVGFAACLYVSVNYIQITDTIFDKPASSILCGAIIIVSVAECLRRTAGPMLFGFVLFFLVFALIGHWIPGHFQGRHVDVDRLIVYVGLDSNGIIGLPIGVVVSIVIAFIFFGNLLNASGGAQFFTEISTALMGRYRGGSAKIAVCASSLFGSISGSAVANVVSTGVITIPLMKKGGYPDEKAAAIEAVASTGGQLMPPMMGAAAFLMAEFLQVPFTDIILAALIPAFLYYLALFIQVDLFAGREKILAVDSKGLRALEVLLAGWLYLSPFVVILVGLFAFNLQPQTAAIYATVLLLPIALVVGYRGERMHWRRIFAALADTGVAVTQLLMVSAMAGVIIGVLNITGLGFAMTQAIIQLSGGNLALILILAAVISIILGMGMPTVGVYLLLATLVVPSMVEAGVSPLAAHMFAFYFGILSMITPPVAAAAFAAATVAKSDFIKTGFAAVAFAWPAYLVPFIFTMSPEMLWQGTAIEILRIVVLSCVGVYLISGGWLGYLMGPLTVTWRIAVILAGIACFAPGGALPGGFLIDLIGLISGGGLIALRKISMTAQVSNV